MDWRDYFTKKELIKNFSIIEAGGDPNENESVSGSDSNPEMDLFQDEQKSTSNNNKGHDQDSEQREDEEEQSEELLNEDGKSEQLGQGGKKQSQ